MGLRGPRPPYDRVVVIDEIMDWVASGRTLSAYCRQPGRPNRRIVHQWIADDPALRDRYDQSREMGCDVLAEDCLRIVDQVPPVTERGSIDLGHVAWIKTQVWTRLQLLAKWCPERYGNRIDVGGSVAVQTDAIEDAYRRARGLIGPLTDELGQEAIDDGESADQIDA